MTDFIAEFSRRIAQRKDDAIRAMVDRYLYPNCPADGEILWMLMQATGINIVVERHPDGSRVSVRRDGIEIDGVELYSVRRLI